MSEFQYYEFQAVDRALSAKDRDALRDISSRATITANSFVNEYNYGDFRGKPEAMMKQWFDLHLYHANWGSRTFMMRLPKRLVDRVRIEDFIAEDDDTELTDAGQNLILSVSRNEMEFGWEEDVSSLLADLAPLRDAVLAGDLRVFYLIWLSGVEFDFYLDEMTEPLPGIGPLTPSLTAFAEFFAIDMDLVVAAAEVSGSAPPPDDPKAAIAGLNDAEKTALLLRVLDGDPHVALDLRALTRRERPAPARGTRTVAELRGRAAAMDLERQEAASAAERKARRERVDALIRRGEGVWREIEDEIARTNAAGYAKAVELLTAMREVAEERDLLSAFDTRLVQIVQRHSRKGGFIARLKALG